MRALPYKAVRAKGERLQILQNELGNIVLIQRATLLPNRRVLMWQTRLEGGTFNRGRAILWKGFSEALRNADTVYIVFETVLHAGPSPWLRYVVRQYNYCKADYMIKTLRNIPKRLIDIYRRPSDKRREKMIFLGVIWNCSVSTSPRSQTSPSI